MLEGLPPTGVALHMRLDCDGPTARRVADVVVETFEPADMAAAAFEATPGSSRPWTVDIYFRHATDEARIRSLLAHVFDDELIAQAVVGPVGEVDWVAASLEGLEAVREGRFIVHGAHGRGRVAPGDIGIEIEAALAFGTGHHGTTRGCLVMINTVARRRRVRHVLDIGTGTGVLAIAIARRFRIKVEAGDIDPVAVETARANAMRNRAGALVRPVRAPGIAHPRLRNKPYDLILANILARPLRALARPLRRRLAPGGEIILSGLLEGDVPGVVSAYRAQGLALVRRYHREGWVTLLMQRANSA